mgnify:CR=1 FL=1
MKTIKQLYHEHKIITLILTSPVWLFVLFSILFTVNEIYKSTQEGVVTEVLNKTLPKHGYSDLYYLNQVKADSISAWGRLCQQLLNQADSQKEPGSLRQIWQEGGQRRC